MAIISWSSD